MGLRLPTWSLPAVPEPGDQIRVLWASKILDNEDGTRAWQDVVLLRMDPAGLWWSPADDAPAAYWSPWRHIEQIEGTR